MNQEKCTARCRDDVAEKIIYVMIKGVAVNYILL